MNYRKQFIITSFLFCILLVIPTKTYSQNNKQVNQLISTVYEKIVTTISTENNSEQKIKEILATHFDERKIGRFTLGAYGRKIPKETFQQYITLTNPRDLFGSLLDITIRTLIYTPIISRKNLSYSLYLKNIQLRANALKFLDDTEATSSDYYATLRSLYTQNRQNETLIGSFNP